MTTIGFLPPSSRHGVCRWRPQSSPMRRPTAVEPVNPTFCTSPSSRARSSPAYVVGPSAITVTRTSLGTPPAWNRAVSAVAIAGDTSPGFHTTLLPAQQRRHEVPGRDGGREVGRGDDERGADGHAVREQLLGRQLARHGLPVEPSPLAEEEVAGVDHLLHLAERLGVGLADLAGHERGEHLLVRLDEAPDRGDDATAGRRRDVATTPADRRRRAAPPRRCRPPSRGPGW